MICSRMSGRSILGGPDVRRVLWPGVSPCRGHVPAVSPKMFDRAERDWEQYGPRV